MPADLLDGRTQVVERYLGTIGVRPGEPTRELLDELISAHVATLPFSSVSVRLGEELPLRLESVADRVVSRRRGGYCFEHNLLMFEALAELGYAPRLVMARVLLNGNPHPGLTHRVSAVTIDGADYLVDVGFGPQGPTACVPFDGSFVGEPWRQVRLVDLGGGHLLAEAASAGQHQAMYRFELTQYGATDCEVGHFYSHRHPESHFVNTLVASRMLPGQTRSLRNRDYWVLRPDEIAQARVADAADLRRILIDELGFIVSEAESATLFTAIAGD